MTREINSNNGCLRMHPQIIIIDVPEASILKLTSSNNITLIRFNDFLLCYDSLIFYELILS